MLKRSCLLCKVVGAIAIIGALNWGILALTEVNVLQEIFGGATRWVYVLVGLSGIALVVSYFYVCPACRAVKA